MLDGLNQIFLEFSSICDKTHLCQFCAHQKNPDLRRGYMSKELLIRLSNEIPRGIIVAAHRNGEPTAYPDLGWALGLFKHHITSIVTHGLNLPAKASEIIDNCTTVTVSIFQNDKDSERQILAIKEFLRLKGDSPPMVQLKIVGDGVSVPPQYAEVGVPILHRLLHEPTGNTKYVRRDPPRPEVGVCLDFLGKPSVDWDGKVYICNRFDPKNHGYLGDLTTSSLDELWNSPTRERWLAAHLRGRRDEASPLCRDCKFFGVPTGG